MSTHNLHFMTKYGNLPNISINICFRVLCSYLSLYIVLIYTVREINSRNIKTKVDVSYFYCFKSIVISIINC